MFNYSNVDVNKILGQEQYIYARPYKTPVKRQKGHKKPTKRRRMLKR